MHHSWASHPRRESSTNASQIFKRGSSEKSLPVLKRPRLFISFRGFMHRKARSTGNSRTSDCGSPLDASLFSPSTSRSRSSASTYHPKRFRQRRGQTPGMDDYLTLTELENVWRTQDTYLGCHDAPQRASGYDFIDPVEVPTVSKHQPPSEHAMAPSPRMREPMHQQHRPHQSQQHRRPHRTHGPQPLNPHSHRKDLPPNPESAHVHLSPPTSFSSRAGASELRENEYSISDRRSSFGSVRPPSPLRPRKSTAEGHLQSQPGSAISPPDDLIPTSIAFLDDDSDSSSTYTRKSPRPSPKQVTRVRDAVVSGVIHPALRSAPYFDSNGVSPSCRVTSQDGMDGPSRNWAYGKV